MQRVKCLLPKKVVITQGNDHKRRNAEKAGTPSGLSVMINKRSKSLDVFDTAMKHNAWVFGQGGRLHYTKGTSLSFGLLYFTTFCPTVR